jgi:copper transport protein
VLPGNQALGSIAFPLPGTYEVVFTIRTSEIDRASVKTTVTVGK